MTTTMLTACGSKSNNQSQEQGETSELVINLDSIVIKPYLAFGSSLADVEKFMSENYADWEVKNPDSLECFPNGEEQSWGRSYGKGTHGMEFDFNDARGSHLTIVSYDFFFPTPLEPVMADLERLGFENKGEVRFDDFNADLTYLFLSADGKLEVQVSSWEKDGGSWSISFQPTDEGDFEHLVDKK